MNQEPITPQEAKNRKMVVLAGPYRKSEHHMMLRAAADIDAGGIEWAYVTTAQGLEIWRTRKGYKHTN